MIAWTVAGLLWAVVGTPAPADPPQEPVELAQLTVRQQIIVRVPAASRRTLPAGRTPIQWQEGRGPSCIDARSILGASLIGQTSVDLVLRNNNRVRARLDTNCPALDYYYGFYISPSADGRICADRDVIRSRMGGQCGIERFRTLRPVARK